MAKDQLKEDFMHAPNQALSILITDDIEENRKWMADIFYSIIPNALIQEAEDGETAVQMVKSKIKTDGNSFNLIIMDFKMPGMNGEKTTDAIRDVEKNIQNNLKSVIITWSTAKSSAYPQADDWLPKLTTKEEVEAILSNYGLM